MYVVSLISGVGIFCLGSAVSLFKGILALTVLHSYSLLFSEIVWGFFVLGFAIITEGVCFFSTVVAAYKDAKENKFGFFYYGLCFFCIANVYHFMVLK